MQQSEFVEAFHRLYVKTRELLDDLEQRNVWSFKETRKYDFDGSGLSWRSQRTVDYWMTLCIIELPLHQTKEYCYLDKLLSRSDLLCNSVDQMIGDDWGSSRFTISELIRHMLAKLLESPTSDPQADIGKLYDKLLAFFKQRTLTRRLMVYLDSVGFESSHLELEKGLTIKNLSIGDKINLLNCDKGYEETYVPHQTYYITREPSSVIEFCFTREWSIVRNSETKTEPKKQYEFRERTMIDDLLHAIRICSSNTVVHSPVLSHRQTGPFSSFLVHDGEHHPCTTISLSTFDKVRENHLRMCYRVLSRQSARATGERIALRRLEQHGRRRSLEDQVLDLFIGIEALMFGAVLAKEKQPDLSEKTFKLCLYVANYVGVDREDREAVFKSLREHYTLRSKVIHGQEPEVKQTHVDSIREVYKRVLFKWLETERERVSRSALQFG